MMIVCLFAHSLRLLGSAVILRHGRRKSSIHGDTIPFIMRPMHLHVFCRHRLSLTWKDILRIFWSSSSPRPLNRSLFRLSSRVLLRLLFWYGLRSLLPNDWQLQFSWTRSPFSDSLIITESDGPKLGGDMKMISNLSILVCASGFQ